VVASVITSIILDEPGGTGLVTLGTEVLLVEYTLHRLGLALQVNKEVTSLDFNGLVAGIIGTDDGKVAILAPVSGGGIGFAGGAGLGVVLAGLDGITVGLGEFEVMLPVDGLGELGSSVELKGDPWGSGGGNDREEYACESNLHAAK
jgi:hypothetical protein